MSNHSTEYIKHVQEQKDKYIEDNTEVLKALLNNRFYKYWKNWKYYIETDNEEQKTLFKQSRLELFLTSSCNQHCEYCYLYKYPGLYPAEANKKETILKNLETLLAFGAKENLYIPILDLFTGEIWNSDFGIRVLELIYEYLHKGLYIECISIPTNASFILNKEQMYKIQNMIDLFKTRTQTVLQFSLSVDGKIIEDLNRPFNAAGTAKTDEFYEDLFLFAKHNTFYFHPMVAAYSIEKWIENFDWWVEMCNKYEMVWPEWVMLLEVRNNDWTEEKIKHYNALMDHVFDCYLKMYRKNSIEEYCKEVLGIYDVVSTCYCPFFPIESETISPCTVPDTLTIRVGDLAIAPCHRTAYNTYLYGYLSLDNNGIKIKANNVEFAIHVLMANHQAHLGCDVCLYNKYCLKGCFGSQYETMGDPLIPIPSVCDLYREKFNHQVQRFEELGVWKYLREHNSPYLFNFLNVKNLLQWVDEVKRCTRE